VAQTKENGEVLNDAVRQGGKVGMRWGKAFSMSARAATHQQEIQREKQILMITLF
jgi:hypothetical protein